MIGKGNRRLGQKYGKMGFALVLCGVCFFCCACGSASVSGQSQGDILAESFLAAHADFQEWQLVGWCKLKEPLADGAALSQYGYRLAEKLNMAIAGERGTEEENYQNDLLLGTIDTVQAEILLQVLPEERYLVLTLTGQNGVGEISANHRKMTNLFADLKADGQINTLITGSISEILPPKEANKRLRRLFTAVDAKIMEQTTDENYCSFTGYQEAIPESVLAGGKKINMQAAVSFDEVANKTWVYLGSPLIFGQY